LLAIPLGGYRAEGIQWRAREARVERQKRGGSGRRLTAVQRAQQARGGQICEAQKAVARYGVDGVQRQWRGNPRVTLRKRLYEGGPRY